MPGIMEGSILILSKAGTGTAMFSMGTFIYFVHAYIYLCKYYVSMLRIWVRIHVHRDIHGTPREVDSMWNKLDSDWDGLEVYCRTRRYGHRISCRWSPRRCPSRRYHSGYHCPFIVFLKINYTVCHFVWSRFGLFFFLFSQFND